MEEDKKVEDAIKNCINADLQELMTQMRIRAKTVWQAQQQTYCRYCHNIFTVGNLDDHQANECTKAPVKCSVCSVMVKRDMMETHKLTQCELREIACACGVKVSNTDLLVHQNMYCELRKVKCRYCPQELKFMDMQGHVDEEHEKLVLCIGGCGTNRKKMDMNTFCGACDGNKIVVCDRCGSNIEKKQQGSCPQCPDMLPRKRWNDFVDSLKNIDGQMRVDKLWLINMWRNSRVGGDFCYYKDGKGEVKNFEAYKKVGSYSLFWSNGNGITITGPEADPDSPRQNFKNVGHSW